MRNLDIVKDDNRDSQDYKPRFPNILKNWKFSIKSSDREGSSESNFP